MYYADSFHLPLDQLMWHYNSLGEYTISNGYLVAMELVQSHMACTSTSEGMYLDMECGVRLGHLETDGHMFWECVFVKAAWLGSSLGAGILPEPGALMRKWLILVVKNQITKFDLVCMVI